MLKPFWHRPKTTHQKNKQRQIFVVRELDPLWLLDRSSAEEYLLSHTAKNGLIYLTNNIGLQIPTKEVFLVNMGTENAQMTLTSIRSKLAGYDLIEWKSSGFPPVNRTDLKTWINQVITETKDDLAGSIIFVVDRSNFDRWLKQLSSDKQEACLIRRESTGEILVAA